jgi:hypothetical protein
LNDNIIVGDNTNNQILFLEPSTNSIVSNIQLQDTKLIDFDINNFNNTLYIASDIDSTISRYNITDTFDKLQSNCSVSLNELTNKLLTISNIKYVSEINGILVATDTGLYLLDLDLTTILTTYDNFNSFKYLLFKDNFIYSLVNSELTKYSTNHYLTQYNEYTFRSNVSISQLVSSTKITSYNNPTIITTNKNSETYLLDNNQILYLKEENNHIIDENIYLYNMYNYNYSLTANIIDMVQNDKYLYILKDDHTIDTIENAGNIIQTITNIPARKITIPNKNNDFYYISNDNKIMKYNFESGTSVSCINNIGIDVDASAIYYYNNNICYNYYRFLKIK